MWLDGWKVVLLGKRRSHPQKAVHGSAVVGQVSNISFEVFFFLVRPRYILWILRVNPSP